MRNILCHVDVLTYNRIPSVYFSWSSLIIIIIKNSFFVKWETSIIALELYIEMFNEIEVMCIERFELLWNLHRKTRFSAVLLDQKLLALVGYLQGLPSGIAGDWPPGGIPPEIPPPPPLDVWCPDKIVSPRLLFPAPGPAPAPCKGEEWWDELEEDSLCWCARLTPNWSANSKWSDWWT